MHKGTHKVPNFRNIKRHRGEAVFSHLVGFHFMQYLNMVKPNYVSFIKKKKTAHIKENIAPPYIQKHKKHIIMLKSVTYI